MKTIKLFLGILLLTSIVGCSNNKYKTEVINGEEFIVYEDIKYQAFLVNRN